MPEREPLGKVAMSVWVGSGARETLLGMPDGLQKETPGRLWCLAEFLPMAPPPEGMFLENIRGWRKITWKHFKNI